MGEMFIPSRVRDRLLEALTELEEEIVAEIQVQVEADDPDAGPYSEEDARNEVQHHVERLTELIDGKTAWLDAAADPWPSWFLDAQRELAELILCRRWIGRLDEMLARLIDIEALALGDDAPPASRTALGQAGVCFMYGLPRASAILTRTALESALRGRIGDFSNLKTAIADVATAGRLSADGTSAAHTVRNLGNRAVHRDERITENDAQNALTAVRVALKELYAIAPGRRAALGKSGAADDTVIRR
jgi:hypothetical protein